MIRFRYLDSHCRRSSSMNTQVVELFSGAGGLSLGLKMAGWQVAVAIESSPDFIETHRINMPDTEHICADVRGINFRQFTNVGMIAGGPPCQPFSVSGKQRGHEDERDMVPEFVRAVREARPDFFLLENVAGLTTPRFLPYLTDKIEALVSLGYDVHWKVLDASNYGVPQKRLRLFVVGVPKSCPFSFPKPTHGPLGSKPFATVRQSLRGCPDDEPNLAKVVYAKNPVLRRSPYAGMLLNGKGRPLNPNAPSKTIPATAGGNRTHVLDYKGVLRAYHAHLMAGGKPRRGVVQNCRRLTLRESARLQTFPDWFEFTGRKSLRYCQVGNAVPPLLAQAIGRAVIRAARNWRQAGHKLNSASAIH
jgi:DNA (cytosine-5)-methyltransferase 1